MTEYKPRSIDYEYTDELVCPYCGYEDPDSWEKEENSDDHLCGRCNKHFQYTTETTRTFISKKADCLNGSEHQWKPMKEFLDIYPLARRCILCGERKYK